jgi:WD40 repeat protein
MSGAKRMRPAEPGTELPGRAQLLLVKTELQAWLGKKFCDEKELLSLLLACNVVRRVRTISVEVRPLGGDSYKVALDAKRPLVGEVKAEIARAQGVREGLQELYKVAVRADGGAVREDDEDPEALDDDEMELRDGEVVAMASKADMFDPLHARGARSFRGHNQSVFCLLVHGDKLLSCSADSLIKVWDLDTLSFERTLEGHLGAVWCLVVHADKLLTCSDDGSIKVWSTESWACERTLDGHLTFVNFLMTYGNSMLSADGAGKIKVWGLDTWTCEHTVDGHACDINCLVLHSDRILSGSDDNTIKVWNPKTWACERTLEGHDDDVNCLVAHGDNLLSASNDTTIKVWSTETWACERTLEGHGGAVYWLLLHDDTLMSSSVDITIKVWDTDQWTCERTLVLDGTGDENGGKSYAPCLTMAGGNTMLSGHDSGMVSTWLSQ